MNSKETTSRTEKTDSNSKRKIVHIRVEDVIEERQAHPELERKYLNPDLYLYLEGKAISKDT